MDNKDNDQCFVNGVDSSSVGVVKNIASSTCEKTEDISGKSKDTHGVQPNDSRKKDKDVPEPKSIIGRNIYKEFERVKAFGTVNNYMPSMNLFEVFYHNDDRVEYVEPGEVLKNLTNNEDICGPQQVPPLQLSNSSENDILIVELGESPTSNNMRNDISNFSSSNSAVKDIEESKKKGKSKSAANSTNKEAETKYKPWNSKRKNATETEPYEPYQFVGLFICKEYKGKRCIGTVDGYSPKKDNKLRVQYKVDGRIEYMTQIEALYSMAKSEDFSSVQPSLYESYHSKKKINKKKDDNGKGSTSGKKK
ncbi:uncharacterized protein [Medicago truncatula]|uniref:uncharacterized protein isoform X1 n=1 Tax=Medicago truncatula TaxID=3880 RepID=UPI001966F551|nr:uncharacterized protein LOC120580709 isoform X1 [Medicago truncatula]